MKKTLPVLIVILSLSVFSFSAHAADVTINSAQTFSSLDIADGTTDGVFTVTGNLIIANGGSITNNDLGVPGNSAGNITITVSGNMEIQSGGSIYAENQNASGSGGVITITVSGSFTMRTTAIISSSNLTATSGLMHAGAQTIHAFGQTNIVAGAVIKANAFKGKAGDIEIISSGSNVIVSGSVLSQSTGTGAGTNQGHGGMIFIEASCTMMVNNDAIISSKGLDPGADLVHIKACTVTIYGLVESTGVGHGIPSSPGNHLSGTHRPGKPENSTAGVEIWANMITIDKLNHNGEVKADLCCSGGTQGRSWIDIIANSAITILGNLNPAASFAVHANGAAGNTDDGGDIKIKSINSTVSLSGLAIQADGTAYGGTISIEGYNTINLSTAYLYARGDFNATGGFGKGGTVTIRSYNSIINWQNGAGDVRPTGTHASLPAASRGVISFQKCSGVIDQTGTSFPNNGTPATTPITHSDACGGNPTTESYVNLPSVNCQTSCAELITLPVRFVSFTAKRNNETATLTWITYSEVNNRGFEIQRRNGNNFDFETVGFVASKAVAGNSSTAITYQYAETNNNTVETYYRLKQIDIDGRAVYSDIRMVTGMKNKSSMLVYPNPAAGADINVSFSSSATRTIQLADMSGTVVRSWKECKADQLKISQLTSGIYILRVLNTVTNEMEMQKIVVTR